jgi:hypothetical protein
LNDKLGPYRIEKELSQGFARCTYAGVHEETGQRVVIRLLPPELSANDAIRDGFLAEYERVNEKIPDVTLFVERDGVSATFFAIPCAETPKKFGPAIVWRKLGEGGMGVVCYGMHVETGEFVAVKVLSPAASRDPVLCNRFLAECLGNKELNHPCIAPVHYVDEEDGRLFYVMECVTRTPWDEVIRDYSLAQNLEVLLKVADAVAYAHSRGFIHRDIKPKNVVVGEFGEARVMNWGLAVRYKSLKPDLDSAKMGGSPTYMAPEMATGPFDKLSPASDIYLLGGILYEIITGNPPHRGEDVMKQLFAAAKNQIVPTGKKGDLVDIAMKAMSTDPADRYRTAEDFQAALRDLVDKRLSD